MFEIPINQKIQQISTPFSENKMVQVLVQREDLIHPICSGNKWWKLKYNLQEAVKDKKESVLTFGGAHSNHILATAYACNSLNLNSIGIIRGEDVKNSTLTQASKLGMELHFIDRGLYRKKDIIDWGEKFNNAYILPEGGMNFLAIKGCQEMLATSDFDYVCCCVGTGGTLAGIVNSLQGSQEAIGIPVLKGGDFLNDIINEYVISNTNWHLNNDYHFGGYAKMTKELLDFMNTFKATFHFSLDPVYTAKLFFGVFDLIQKGFFKKKSKVLILHSGGLQGIEAMNKKIKSKGWRIE